LVDPFDQCSKDAPNTGFGYNVRLYFAIGVCSLAYLLGKFHRFSSSVLADMMAPDFKVPKARLGIFSSLFFWPYGLMQPIVGAVCDVIDSGFVIGWASMVATLGAVVIGVSSALPVAYVGRLLVGLSCAFFYCATTKIAHNWINPLGFRMFTGYMIAIGGVGSLLAQTPLSLLGHAVGWRSCIIGVAVVSLICGIICFIFVRSHPHAFGYQGTYKWHPPASAREIFRQLGRNMLRIVRNGDFWILELVMFCSPGAYMDLSAMWAVPFVEDVYGTSPKVASIVALPLSIAMMVGAPILPAIAEKIRGRKLTMFVAHAIGTLCCLIMTVVGDRLHIAVVGIFYFIICIGTFLPQGIELPLFCEYDDPSMAAALIGSGNTGPFIGSGLLQIVSTVLLESYGTHKHYPFRAYQIGLWSVLTLFGFMSTYGVIWVRENKPIKD
jgi:predicted MFS family arabinose efflux permease